MTSGAEPAGNMLPSKDYAISVVCSDSPPILGFKFYIGGTYYGSAPSKNAARNAAKDMVKKMKAHWQRKHG